MERRPGYSYGFIMAVQVLAYLLGGLFHLHTFRWQFDMPHTCFMIVCAAWMHYTNWVNQRVGRRS